MPDFTSGGIKYPSTSDTYNDPTYGGNRWFRDLAITAQAAIDNKTPLRIENSAGRLSIDSAGGMQHAVGGSRVWWSDDQGVLREGEVPWARVTGAPPAASPAGMKTVPLALTTGTTGVAGAASRSVRFPLRFNAPVNRWRVHIRNWNPRLGTVIAAPVNFTGLWLADTSGAGTVTGTPTQLAPAFTTPADGSEWVSGWYDAPIGGDVERLLCYGFDTAQSPWLLTGGSYQASGSASAISGAVTPGPGTSFDIWIEAETPASTPVVAGVGDSLTAGTGATLPVFESWLSQYTRRVGALPMHVAHHGDSMRGFLTVNPGKVTRWEDLARADAVVWGLGSNDLSSTRTISEMQADFATLLPIVEAAVGPVRHVSTVQPRNSWDAAAEARRSQWNTWLTSRPEVRGVLDFASVVSVDGDTLLPEYDSGDGTHLNTAGYQAEADSITTPLVASLADPDWSDAIAALNAAAD